MALTKAAAVSSGWSPVARAQACGGGVARADEVGAGRHRRRVDVVNGLGSVQAHAPGALGEEHVLGAEEPRGVLGLELGAHRAQLPGVEGGGGQALHLEQPGGQLGRGGVGDEPAGAFQCYLQVGEHRVHGDQGHVVVGGDLGDAGAEAAHADPLAGGAGELAAAAADVDLPVHALGRVSGVGVQCDPGCCQVFADIVQGGAGEGGGQEGYVGPGQGQLAGHDGADSAGVGADGAVLGAGDSLGHGIADDQEGGGIGHGCLLR